MGGLDHVEWPPCPRPIVFSPMTLILYRTSCIFDQTLFPSCLVVEYTLCMLEGYCRHQISTRWWNECPYAMNWEGEAKTHIYQECMVVVLIQSIRDGLPLSKKWSPMAMVPTVEMCVTLNPLPCQKWQIHWVWSHHILKYQTDEVGCNSNARYSKTLGVFLNSPFDRTRPLMNNHSPVSRWSYLPNKSTPPFRKEKPIATGYETMLHWSAMFHTCHTAIVEEIHTFLSQGGNYHMQLLMPCCALDP